MKFILLIIFIFFTSRSFSQNDTMIINPLMTKEFKELDNKINKLQNETRLLSNSNISLRKNIVLKDSILFDLKIKLTNTSDTLNNLYISIDSIALHTKILQQDLNTNKDLFIWIVSCLLLIIIISLIYFIKTIHKIKNLKKEYEKSKLYVEEVMSNSDSELLKIINNQLSILKNNSNDINTEHKLAIKVADEIHRMKKRLNNISIETKGISALSNSLERLEEELIEHGYVIENLMGKKYIDGMNVEARFIDNPDISPGEEIITQVIKPQVNYKGKVLQIAKVEVSKSY